MLTIPGPQLCGLGGGGEVLVVVVLKCGIRGMGFVMVGGGGLKVRVCVSV